MKRLFLVVASLTWATLTGLGAASSFTVQYGQLLLNPQIDAINVTNYGSISASSIDPFETFDTLNFVNFGTMIGIPGFRFDTFSNATGFRTKAASFLNLNSGVIQVSDIQLFTTPCTPSVSGSSYLLISATNIVNRGSSPVSLIVGAGGLLQLEGNHIDLTRSGIAVTPVWGQPVGSTSTTTNFTPDVAIFDKYAAQSNFTATLTLNTAGLWNGTSASAPAVPRPAVTTAFTLLNPISDSYVVQDPASTFTLTITNFTGSITNVTGTNLITISLSSNLFKGAVFAAGASGLAIQEGFAGGTVNFFNNIGAVMTVQIPNTVSALPDLATIYIQDTLAGETARGLRANTVGCPPSGNRPGNYLVERADTVGLPGAPGLGVPDAAFFTTVGIADTNIASQSVTNATVRAGEYSGYSAFFDNVVSRPVPIASATVTNLPGRVIINADTLDATMARVRGEGLVTIHAGHLISSKSAVFDCENLSLDLSETNGNLQVKNIAPDAVARLRGQIYLFSALWTNVANIIVTNNYAFTNVDVTPAGSTNGVTNVVAIVSPLTNQALLFFHTLMVDATALQTALPVSVYDLVSHSTNTVLTDNATVIQSLLFGGQSLTLQGNLTIAGAIPPNPLTGTISPGTPFLDWTHTNAPNLLYFTNHGTFLVPNEAHFGDDGPKPYLAFVNTGMVRAASIQINSAYIQNNGTLQSAGPLFMTGGTAKLEDGLNSSVGVTKFLLGNLKFNNYQLSCGDAIYFQVTNSLADAGPKSGNVLQAPFGFNLLMKPLSGDLLGTTFRATAPRFVGVNHTWAAEDRGLSVLGYSNNQAIGTLELSAGDRFALHFFQGTGGHNAIYVDLLDLAGLADYTNQLAFAPDTVLYFAAVNVSFVPPNNAFGIPQGPEEYLDGQFGGHLRWAQTYAGANSSVDVLINNKTVKVNKALRFSKIIDSNGNGIPNFYDSNPFDGLVLTMTPTNAPALRAVNLSWNALPNTVYQVQFTTDLASGKWQTLFNYTNTLPVYGPVTVQMTNSPSGTGYYRASYGP